MKASVEISLDSSPLIAHYVPRPRIDRVFDNMARCKLLYVVAGAGYGKTQAVYHYIKQQTDATVRWIQLTENDNMGSRYWENLTYSVSLDNPELALKLRELGFPETLARFRQFAEILKTTEHRSHKTVLVLDDFHLIHSKQALTFAERCAHLQIPGACVIIISRKEPEINAVTLFSKGNAGIITEDELRFTEDEIANFFKQRDIPLSLNALPKILDATKGWALAVKLLSLALKRTPQNLDRALYAMKQNVFKLLETEAFDNLPEPVQKQLAQLSLISDLPVTPLDEIFHDALFTQYAPQLTPFIWFDSFSSNYRIHPLYLEFLQMKQYILSEDEKQNIYRRTVQWCFDNNFYTDAMKYCAKSRQFDRMREVLFSYPFKLPHDVCEYFLNILEEIDCDNKEKDNHSALFLKNFFIPILLIGMGGFEEARERSFDVIRKWEHLDTPFAFAILSAAYSNLSYIDMYTCTVTHNYDSPKYLKKSVEYHKRSSLPQAKAASAFLVADVRSFACLVGEGADLPEFDQFLENTRETALYIAETSHGMYYGYDDLVACELAFFKNQHDSAIHHAHNAVLKAREKKQYSIEIMAQFYLLCLAMHEGDYSLTKEMLKHMRDHLDNPDFWNRQLLYDLFTGSFYAQIELPGMMPSWLAIDGRAKTSEVHIPVREIIVSVRHYLAARKYKQAFTILCNSSPRAPQHRFLFGELIISLLFAVTRLKTGDTDGAVKDFEKAYKISFEGVLEMPFIELGKEFRLLAAAASRQADCSIPEDWLKKVERKASIYAKKTAVIKNSFKEEKNIKDAISLSEREREVLGDLYHGLSREEIAENRFLSINTVKKILQSIYIKLDAYNSVDAIRIAIDKKLIE